MKNQNLVAVSALATIEDQKSYIHNLGGYAFDKLLAVLDSKENISGYNISWATRCALYQICLERAEAEYEAAGMDYVNYAHLNW